jgi:hypothetical protein
MKEKSSTTNQPLSAGDIIFISEGCFSTPPGYYKIIQIVGDIIYYTVGDIFGGVQMSNLRRYKVVNPKLRLINWKQEEKRHELHWISTILDDSCWVPLPFVA